MALQVLSSGVDTLHASMRGTDRPVLWELGQEAQQRARGGDPEPVELANTGQTFRVQGARDPRLRLVDVEPRLGADADPERAVSGGARAAAQRMLLHF
jgi:hypothetical protein